MNWLFVHRSFPGQYVHDVAFLARQGETVVAIAHNPGVAIEGVRTIAYANAGSTALETEYAKEFDFASRNAAAVADICERLKAEGFTPDIVIGHNGWGEILFLKDIWPGTPLLGYFEFFYRAVGGDVDFDPEFPPDPESPRRVRLRNAVNLLGLEAVDRGQTPTQWQRSLYPRIHHDKISVIHEGVDSDAVRPDASARMWLKDVAPFSSDETIVTFCARDLEPYRGFHVFMRALPEIMKRLPEARILIVGGDGVSYGRWPAGAPNWREKMLAEVGDRLDRSRVYFLKPLNFRQYLTVLQISTVHLYLTYPFVLSWSLLEAMAAGCFIIASRTPPIEEVVRDGDNGWLFDFFDVGGLADRVVEAARRRAQLRGIREAARGTIEQRFDLTRVVMPARVALWEDLIGAKAPWKSRPRPRRHFNGAAPAPLAGP